MESQNNGGSFANGESADVRDQAWDLTALAWKYHPDRQPPFVNWG
jgi:hypothetical protein